MFKKILSLMLCFALMATFMTISVNAAEISGVMISQDFEDAEHTAGAAIYENAEMITDTSGNTLFDLSTTYDENNRAYDASRIIDTSVVGKDRPQKYVVEFDLNVIDASGPFVVIMNNTELTDTPWIGVNIFPSTFGSFTQDSTSGLINDGDGQWYNFRIYVDETKYDSTNSNTFYRPKNCFSIKYKKFEEIEWLDLECNTGGTWVQYSGFRPIQASTANSHSFAVPSSGYLAIGAYSRGNSFGTKSPHYQIDNLNVFAEDTSLVSSVHFENATGTVLTAIPNGTVTAKYNVENFGGLTSAKAVIAAFDKNGSLVKIEPAEVTLSSGMDIVSAEIDLSDVYSELEDGRVEAYLLTADGEPLDGIIGVLGKRASIEKSTSTAELGTDGTAKTNSFSALDRSAYANEITVEGKHSTGTRNPVIINAVGDSSGKVFYSRQLNSKTDGSFKVSFAINPDDCEDDTTATVTISGIDTTAKTFGIPAFSNWNAMIAEFLDAAGEEAVQAYIDTYLDNLAVYESGKENLTEADVASIDYGEMAFIKSMNTYSDDMTYTEIVETVLGLIADTRAAEAFVADFAAAQALETEPEQLEKIKELIVNCEIIEFSTAGASNVDAICKALIFSEKTTLEGIYTDFYEAWKTQKKLEEETVPGFTSITGGTEMKQFFADNETVLGVDPETYSDADYKVMYGVYAEKEYDTLTTYEAVNDAIVFLDNYINEYNRFIELITNAATVEKNPETIKALLGNTYTYIEIDLADESAVVNKEYLYARLIDMDCKSLDTIEAAFADAVAAQTAYEIAAKDAFITIIDETSIKAYFTEYADMMGVSDAKNYTDAELTVFVEVYNKFSPTATNYTDAVTQTKNQIEKHKTAMKFIADINAEAKEKDWAGIKALYEGDICDVLIGMGTATTNINDIRSMYMRIANNAPYGTLAEIENAWNTAYSIQDEYEDIAGGYATFDDELCYFDDTWTFSVQGNVIHVTGKVDTVGARYVTFHAESEGDIIYARQMKTEKDGSFELEFILNPLFYNADAEGTLRVGGDMINIYEFRPFELYSEAELKAMVDTFLGITDRNSLKLFLDEYSDELSIDVDTSDERVMEAMTFVYLRDKEAGKYDAITDITEILNGAADGNGMLSIMLEMREMISCLVELTKAANKKFNNTLGQWAKIKDQVQYAITRAWITPEVSGTISDETSLYLQMAGKNYNYMSEVEAAYENAHSAQYDEENNTSTGNTGNTGGGGGGGGTANGSKLPITSGNGGTEGNSESLNIGTTSSTEKELATNLESHPESPFKDVTSDYSWAKDSIDRLRRYNLISGDGNGNFRPGNGISREEFLKILLNVFAIELDEDARAAFADVDANDWYYGYVATAYNMGIIKGYTNGSFGIGDVVTRADMAVMVLRTMDMLKIELEATDRAQAFTDYDKIPEYAYHSVTRLQQAGILNGDSFGNFNASNGLTRAEAAVVFATLFNDMNDFVTYSWEKVY